MIGSHLNLIKPDLLGMILSTGVLFLPLIFVGMSLRFVKRPFMFVVKGSNIKCDIIDSSRENSLYLLLSLR